MSIPIPEPPKYESQPRYFHVIVKDGEFTDLNLTYKTKPDGNTLLNLFLGLLKELKPEHTWTLDKQELSRMVEIKSKPKREPKSKGPIDPKVAFYLPKDLK